MPSSLARPPTQLAQRQRRGRNSQSKLTVGAWRRPGWQHRRRSQSCGGTSATIQLATASRSSGIAMAKRPPHHHIREAPGLQTMPSNRRWRPRSSRKTPRRRSSSPGRAKAGQAAGGKPDWATNGVEEDELRRGRQIPAVRRESVKRRIICPTQRRWRPPELIGGARRCRRRCVVARAREG
jgi:hypothetical protein